MSEEPRSGAVRSYAGVCKFQSSSLDKGWIWQLDPAGSHEFRSQRLKIFHQVPLLFRVESQTQQPFIMVNDICQVAGATIMEVGRVLPECAKRRRPVLFCRATHGIQRIRADLRRVMQ